jgi:hypothetical protein
VNQLLFQYSYLQVLDLMTTVAFLLHGIREANPLVRVALDTPHPLSGLIAIKILAVALGFYCWRAGRKRLLLRMNILFAVVVAWNMVALIVASASLKLI